MDILQSSLSKFNNENFIKRSAVAEKQNKLGLVSKQEDTLLLLQAWMFSVSPPRLQHDFMIF
jgi:hypothetical protein